MIIETTDLLRSSDMERLRDVARQQAFHSNHQAPLWFHRAYADLAHAADVLAAFLQREGK